MLETILLVFTLISILSPRSYHRPVVALDVSLVQYKMSLKRRAIPTQEEPEGMKVGMLGIANTHAGDGEPKLGADPGFSCGEPGSAISRRRARGDLRLGGSATQAAGLRTIEA